LGYGERDTDRRPAGAAAPEVWFGLPTLTLARRVGADSSPIHSAALTGVIEVVRFGYG
jgi:hypothetical protein